jgi:hypothetical protein
MKRHGFIGRTIGSHSLHSPAMYRKDRPPPIASRLILSGILRLHGTGSLRRDLRRRFGPRQLCKTYLLSGNLGVYTIGSLKPCTSGSPPITRSTAICGTSTVQQCRQAVQPLGLPKTAAAVTRTSQTPTLRFGSFRELCGSEGLPVPSERRTKPSEATMAKRGFLRESGGHDARSERPARWHGQPRQLRINPRKSLMSLGLIPRRIRQQRSLSYCRPSPAADARVASGLNARIEACRVIDASYRYPCAGGKATQVADPLCG